jgi:hypothetical protein
MKSPSKKPVPVCPVCARPVPGTPTRFGRRHECCGLHSWDYRPLVDPAVHAARKTFVAAINGFCERTVAETLFVAPPGHPSRLAAESVVAAVTRRRLHRWLAALFDLPPTLTEPAKQDDLVILNALIKTVEGADTSTVRRWAKILETKTARMGL